MTMTQILLGQYWQNVAKKQILSHELQIPSSHIKCCRAFIQLSRFLPYGLSSQNDETTPDHYEEQLFLKFNENLWDEKTVERAYNHPNE